MKKYLKAVSINTLALGTILAIIIGVGLYKQERLFEQEKAIQEEIDSMGGENEY